MDLGKLSFIFVVLGAFSIFAWMALRDSMMRDPFAASFEYMSNGGQSFKFFWLESGHYISGALFILGALSFILHVFSNSNNDK